ncbi:DUF4982 domain-containing protein [Prolixibacteraceae bacterium Z1-6]|uniref:DUF4982 domain-containing protein n=1 Tax=Draconibacterium aestuarii TaxID=2998507 RepID=A0A9X3J4P0_9BACT|nr:DUF4982 domain-containing protein [Prolixibacteraceae bacterium Z1-6]
MKHTKLLTYTFLICLFSFSAMAQRQIIPLNKEWHYTGSSIWEDVIEKTVDIPHSWNTEDAAQGYKYFRGEGRYEKDYFLPESYADKRLFLKFEGAQTVADVTVNGKYLGQHRGGYSAFVFEITDVVKFGSENHIDVKVENSPTGDVLPLGGDFNIYGGIYRPVKLIVTNKICITPLDFASPGVYLKQKNVSTNKADIDAKVKVSNANKTAEKVDVDVTIFDANGNEVQKNSSQIVIEGGQTSQAEVLMSIAKPHLWNGLNDPYLYSASISIKKDGAVIDEITQPLGLRYYSTDSGKGFFLNGEYVKIKGVSRHNDFAGVASALSEKHHRTDMALIKEMGANGIRLAHYQHSDFFYSLADTSGMIVWAEIPFVGSDVKGYSASDSFAVNAKQQLRELIRQNYNHPSILFWGLYNEIGMKKDSLLVELIDELHSVAKSEDETRETTAASFITKSENELHKIPEMIAWNQYYGWYYSKADDLGDFLDRIHSEQPEYKIGVSEYGAGGSPLQHEEKIRRPFPFFHPWHPEEFQATVHEGNWKAIAERPYVWGSFVWNMFDFGSHFRREGDAIGMNDKGMVTYDRKTKKDVFYFYKANWSEEPVIRITNSGFKIREQDKIDVKVYSNLDNVELFVNGESAGIQKGDYATLVWKDIQLNKGNNQVKVVGQRNGESYSHSVVWMYEKNTAIAFGITFLRWLIKPFVVILLVLIVVLIRLLFWKRTKGWKKAIAIISFVLVTLIFLIIVLAQIFASSRGMNLFEYSLI